MPSFKTTLPCSDIEVTVEYSITKEYGEIKTEIEQVLLEDGSEVPYKEWWYEARKPTCPYGSKEKRSMVTYFESKVDDDFDGDTLEEFYAGIAEARNDERNER